MFRRLGNYFLASKNNKVIERNRIQVNNARAKLMKDGGLDNLTTAKKSGKYKVVTPQEIVKLYDNTLQVYANRKLNSVLTLKR